MSPLEQVNRYLNQLERRLRVSAATRGVALTAGAALLATVLLVIYANSNAFSEPSLRVSRFLLFLSLAFAVAFGIFVPLLALNRRRTARRAEAAVPAFQERLLTFAGKHPHNDPFLELLAEETMQVANSADPEQIAATKWVFGSVSAAAAAFAVLIWLIVAGPGFLGHGSSLLWAGAPRAGMRSAFYDIVVTPGNKSVRKRSDQTVHAEMVGFDSKRATLFARFSSASKWEPVPMDPQPNGSGWEFLFASLPESVDYYVEAGGVRSKTFKLTALDLPGIQKLKVSYRYPRWAGLRDAVEDPGGDLRAVEGSEATVTIVTDKPLGNAALVLDDGTRIAMTAGEGNSLSARVPIQKDGMYHVATAENREDVRLSQDYFIEAQKEEPPTVRIARPGRDFKVSPIEEVTVNVDADDDFGVQDLTLHYSVNGGPEKTIPLLKTKGAKSANGETMISLEEFKLAPGDVVSLYAKARDARSEATTDILFLEAQPFEREYSQADSAGGGGGGGGEAEEGAVTQRQKEIIAATFNQLRDKGRDKSLAAENAKFLSEMQGKLRDQSKSLADRMRRRELSGNNQEFQSFARDMQQAADAMGTAVDKLKAQSWRDAIAPEQKALQHLLRAEATRRQIQVAFGSRGGGGGGGGAGRDLENLFDLELDTEKNQYETGQQMASADQRSREMEDALQRLERLARRQQELAEQQKDSKQTPQQRWQQEMLRREAEQLQKQMEQMARGQQGQSGQQSSSSASASSSSSSSSSQQQQRQQRQQQQAKSGQGSIDPRVQQALDRIQRATEDMRRASSAQAQGNNAEARRAAERLREAQEAVKNLRQQESGTQMDDLARRAGQLADQQREFVRKLRKTFGEGNAPQPGTTGTQQREQAEALAREKEAMLNDMNRLEKDMQNAARNLAGSQRNASSKVREALGDMQQEELRVRMKFSADWLRRGYGPYMAPRELPVTNGLDKLRDQLKEAQAAVGSGSPNGKDQQIERALSQVEKLRQQMARAAGQGQRRGQPGKGQQPGNQQGQNGKAGDPGQQGQGEQGQSGQQQAGNSQQGRGQQSGSGMMGGFSGEVGRGGDRGPGGRMGVYRSGENVPEQGAIYNGADAERAFRDGLRELSQLRQSMSENPDVQKDINELMHEMQKYDPSKLTGNPAMIEQLRTQVLPNIEQLELQLRRKLESNDSGNVRSGAAESVPQGYGEAAAEYFRRLSKAK